MTPEQFCYWLRGHFELSGDSLTAAQSKTVREHLDTVIEPRLAAEKLKAARVAEAKKKKLRKKKIVKTLLHGDLPKGSPERDALRDELKVLQDDELKELLRPYRTTSYNPHKRIC